MKNEYRSSSPEETIKIAKDFSKSLRGGEVIAFTGDLGMGKTCFVRGIAEGLGYNGDVTSPTFSIVNEYVGGSLDLYHFDMYRITGWDDLESTGYFDYLSCGGVIAVEWSENIASALEPGTIFVNFKRLSDTERIISVIREDKP